MNLGCHKFVGYANNAILMKDILLTDYDSVISQTVISLFIYDMMSLTLPGWGLVNLNHNGLIHAAITVFDNSETDHSDVTHYSYNKLPLNNNCIFINT